MAFPPPTVRSRLGSEPEADFDQVHRFRVASERIPWILITRPDTPGPLDQDGMEQIQADKLQGVGKALALALTRIVRQTSY